MNFGSVSLSIAPPPQPENASIEGTLSRIDRFGLLERMFAEKIGPVDAAPEDVEARFVDMVGDFSTPLSFATVVLLAAVLYALFRRRPLFVEHAVFSMHYFSFVLFASLVSVVAVDLGLVVVAVLAVLFSVILWQVRLSRRRAAALLLAHRRAAIDHLGKGGRRRRYAVLAQRTVHHGRKPARRRDRDLATVGLHLP